MPLDGLSFSNSGLFRIITPSEVAHQAEQTAKAQAEIAIKKLEEKEKIKADIDGKKEDERKDGEGRDTQENEEEQPDESVFQNQDNIKKYKVKFNKFTDMVELVDQKTGKIIETISPDDLINLVSKSFKPSGILVDKQI